MCTGTLSALMPLCHPPVEREHAKKRNDRDGTERNGTEPCIPGVKHLAVVGGRGAKLNSFDRWILKGVSGFTNS